MSRWLKKQRCKNRVLWRPMVINNFTEQTYKMKSSRSWQSPLESGTPIYTVVQINSKLGSSVKETNFQLFSRILKLKGLFFSTQTVPCHCNSFSLNRISIRNKKIHSVITLFPPNLCQYIFKIEKLKEHLFLTQALLH